MRVYQYELCYGMAEGYEISEDGCTYRFFLREDACYSDGPPVQAADFQRTMRRLAAECYLPSQLGLIENAREVYKGELPPEELAVWTEGQRTLCIQLEHPALPTYAPTRSDRGETLRPEDCKGLLYWKDRRQTGYCPWRKTVTTGTRPRSIWTVWRR